MVGLFLFKENDRMKISVCLIVKNEESQLERALTSIPIGCEVIIVDTGSNDRTVEVATRLGAKVYSYEWNNHFGEARNASIQHATGDHIFIMDADEQLPGDWELTLRYHLKQFPNQPATVLIHNITEGETTAHYAVRLFPNNGDYLFKGRVHEQLYYGEEAADFIRSSVKINHYGYSHEQYMTKGKFERYVRLYKEELTHQPKDGYMLYQLGKLYYSVKQYNEAYETLIESVSLQQYERFYYPPMLVILGYSMKEMNCSSHAYELLAPFAHMYLKFPDMQFLLGMLAMETGQLDQIEYHFKQALSIGDTDYYTTVVGCGSFRAAHNLAVFYEVTGKTEKAQTYYNLAAEQNFVPSISRLKEI